MSLFLTHLRPLHATIHHPGIRLEVEQVTYGRIVLVAHLWHLKLWIDSNPKPVLAVVQVTDIHPLAVNVVFVNVIAIDGDTLVPEIGAKVFLLDARLALVILQAEAGLMSFCNAFPLLVENVERSEHLHGVIMPAERDDTKRAR